RPVRAITRGPRASAPSAPSRTRRGPAGSAPPCSAPRLRRPGTPPAGPAWTIPGTHRSRPCGTARPAPAGRARCTPPIRASSPGSGRWTCSGPARVQDDPVAGDTGLHGLLEAGGQVVAHLLDDVVVLGAEILAARLGQ